MLDFTLKKYKELCGSIIHSGYRIVMVERYFSQSNLPDNFVILRHDVDRKPGHAETMASIENDMGIKSTYYFRKNSPVFKPKIIKHISQMGHEIGYHYEVLDKAKGDIKKAYLIFREELEMFRDIVDIKTVSMHGNPFTRWTNSDFWKKNDLADFNLIGEASFSTKNNNILYFTDTGRNWDPLKYNIKDFISTNSKMINIKAQKTDDLIDLISKSNSKFPLYLSVHPNRWNDNTLSWVLQFVEDYLVNQLKCVVRFLKPGIKNDGIH
tara:strand:+ start:19837 stop:20637 length:801 start_codon:yes stop_codon:yes gene_type:complete